MELNDASRSQGNIFSVIYLEFLSDHPYTEKTLDLDKKILKDLALELKVVHAYINISSIVEF